MLYIFCALVARATDTAVPLVKGVTAGGIVVFKNCVLTNLFTPEGMPVILPVNALLVKAPTTWLGVALVYFAK